MDLSVLIPARNEEFLARTIEGILENIEVDTEVIAVCDGTWPKPPVKDHPRVTLIHHAESIGQRAATNEAARLATGKFVMKLDAHCTVDKGFDRKLMADCEYDWTIIPRMYNLHGFNWRCKNCGKETYQGPTKTLCDKCQGTEFERIMIWKKRDNRRSDHWRFDKYLHFQYWGDFSKRPEAKGDLVPTMSFIGACWFMHRDRYWELEGLDEKHGSWGQVGTEVSCKTWLSGGKLLTNKKTWYSHLFRTQGGDFSFPYPIKGSDQERSRRHSRNLWINNTWAKQKYPLSWLIKKFWPIPGWEEIPIDSLPPTSMPVEVKLEESSLRQVVQTKALVYYTDSHCAEHILLTCRKQLERCMEIHKFPIISVSQSPINFGQNIVMDIPRSVLSLYKQILRGLEESTADYIFLIEHDVIYHPSHFEFTPPRNDTFYFNRNRWAVSADTGKAVFYQSDQVSLCCATRKLLIKHYKKVIGYLEMDGFKQDGFSPPKGVPREQRVGHHDTWFASIPVVDIRHSGAYTPIRMDKKDFRNEKSCRDWQESDGVPGWNKTLGRFDEFLKEVYNGKGYAG